MAMMTVYSEKHLLRNPRTELYGGELVTPDECAQRAEFATGALVVSLGINAVNVLQGFG